MRALEKIALAGMHCIDPERAHGLAVQSLKMGLGFGQGPIRSPRLSSTLAGMDLANPVGLAAGFDKNAEVVGPLAQAGFGFIEVGAATPRPQPGNPKPRLFRLTEDQAAINRFGFNNEGMDVIAERLASRVVGIPVGLNLGANKDSEDRAQDFATVLRRCGPHVDFATVNVSSPNTEKLRDLQGRAALSALLAGVMGACGELRSPIPVFLKIAPDLVDDALVEIAEVAVEAGLAGIIATNTTLSRDGLTSPHKGEAGGLSGQPVFEKSTRVLARLSELLDGAMPLVGVGGVGSAEQAYAKIRAGASAVQIYTAMVYGGLSLAGDIAQGLDALLERDGFNSVTEAVGTGRSEWL